MRRLAHMLLLLALAVVVSCAVGRRATAPPIPEAAQGGRSTPWITPDAAVPGVRHLHFDSAVAGQPVSLHVFVPEPYAQDPALRLPVIYYLHGTSAGIAGIRPLTQRFAAAMRRGDMPLALVVYPFGQGVSLWIDSADGRVPMETMVLTELVPFVDASFRTVASPEGRLVEGFSMGGYGAARYGFAHPDVFGAVSILAGGPLQTDFREGPRSKAGQRERLLDALFGGSMARFYEVSPWNQAAQAAEGLRDGRPVQVVVGEEDALLEHNRAFSAHLASLGIAHELVVVPGVGHHAPGLLDGMGASRWAFYRRALGR